jgi:hypothetical protein
MDYASTGDLETGLMTDDQGKAAGGIGCLVILVAMWVCSYLWGKEAGGAALLAGVALFFILLSSSQIDDTNWHGQMDLQWMWLCLEIETRSTTGKMSKLL